MPGRIPTKEDMSMVREPVRRLVEMGPFPPESDELSDEVVEGFEKIVRSLPEPVTNEEARALTGVFGDDGFYDLASYLVHVIETAPGWPLVDALRGNNQWIEYLADRSARAGVRVKDDIGQDP